MNKQGVITIEQGARVLPHELRTAQALARYCRQVTLLSSKGAQTKVPDASEGILFEIKSPESHTTHALERNIRRALKQADNIIIDSQRIKRISDRSLVACLINTAKRIPGIKRLWFVDKKRALHKLI